MAARKIAHVSELVCRYLTLTYVGMQVATLYNNDGRPAGVDERTASALKSKFKKMSSMKPPTGRYCMRMQIS